MPLNPAMAGNPKILAAPDHLLTAAEAGLKPMLDPEEEYWHKLGDLDARYEDALRRRWGKAYPQHIDPYSYHFDQLLPKDKQAFTMEMNDLVGSTGIINKGIGPSMFRDYEDIHGRPARSPAGSHLFAPSELLSDHPDPRVLAMSQQTVRFDRTAALTGSHYYSVGTDRPGVQRFMQGLVENKLQTAGSTAFIDVESPGLDPAGGIWQLSARMMRPGQEVVDKTWHFDNAMMRNLGQIGPDGQRLTDFLSGANRGEFKGQMKEFLEFIDEADWMAGHNVSFDYGMLERGLRPFEKDRELAPLIARFRNRFYNEETGELGNVFDTNAMAKFVLPHIPLDPHLAEGATPYKWSMQNILLQTDVLARIREEVGDDQVDAWLARGTHYADVDVPLESYLYKYMQEHAQGGRQIQVGGGLVREAEARMLRASRAIGPNIPLSSVSQIHPSLLGRVTEAGLIDFDEAGEARNINLTPLEQMVLLNRDMTLRGGAPQAVAQEAGYLDQIRAKDARGVFSHLKRKFWDVPPAGGSGEVGMWARMSKGWLGQSGQMLKGGTVPFGPDWAVMQEELRERGVPLAGMSWPERNLSALMGQVARGAPKVDREIASIFGAESGLSRFVEAPKVDVVGASNILTVPLKYMKEWEVQRRDAGEAVNTAFGDPSRLQFGYLQAFRHHNKQMDEIAWMLPVEGEEKESLRRFLTGHPDFSQDATMVRRISSAFENNTGTYGVQVGTMAGLKGGTEVSRVADFMRSLFGEERSAKVYVPLAHYESEAGAFYGAGAYLHPEIMNDAERAAIIGENLVAGDRYKRLSKDVSQMSRMTLYQVHKDHGALGNVTPLAESIDRWAQVAAKRGPLLLGAAAVGVGGYYLHQRNKRNEYIDQTMQVQPPEPRDWYETNQANTIPARPMERTDYLQTASVTRNLDARKINHTLMGTSKYDNLFPNVRGY